MSLLADRRVRNPDRKIHNAPMKERTTAAMMPARISIEKIIACGKFHRVYGVVVSVFDGVRVRVEVGVLDGVRVCVGVSVGVRVGRGVRVSEGVQVGGGGLVGVRVQVGMGVRLAVGVADSAAMNVLLRSVRMAEVVSALPSIVGVRDGVREAVAEGPGVEVAVAETGSVAV